MPGTAQVTTASTQKAHSFIRLLKFTASVLAALHKIGRVLQLGNMLLSFTEVCVWPKWKKRVPAGYWDMVTLPRTTGQSTGSMR